MLGHDRDGLATMNGAGEGAIASPARTLDLDLDPPIEVNGRSYASVHLEEPTARMVERAEAEVAASFNMHTMRKYQIALVSQVSGLPRAVVEQMRISQVCEATDFLSAFIGSGRPTGET